MSSTSGGIDLAHDDDSSGHHHREGRRRRQAMQMGVWAIAALAAVGGVLAAGRPTGFTVIDALWRAFFAGLVTLATSRSRRWPCIWLAGVTTAVTSGLLLVFSVGSLALATVGIFTRTRHRLLGALIGALAVQPLLRIPDLGFHGFSALVAAAAVLPAMWSAYDCAHRSTRRAVRRTIAVAAGVTLLAAIGFGVGAILAYPDLDQAVDTTRAGRQLLRQPDLDAAAGSFQRASQSFSNANSAVDAPWTLPARFIPVLAQHADMLSTASSSGAELTESAAAVAKAAPYQDLRAAKGQVDLATVDEMQEPVAESVEVLRDARGSLDDVDSAWLASPVSSQLHDVMADLDDAIPEAELAAESLELAPGLLGQGGRRQYLVLFTTPAETRFLGGFVGAYGVLTAENGKVTFDESGSISQLAAKTKPDTRTIPEFEGRKEYLARYSRYRPEVYLQNLSVSPDFPTDAFVARDLYRQTTGQNVDGVIVVDPTALAGFLRLTGPVAVDESAQRITAKNVEQYLLADQYSQFENETEERRERLSAVADATFDALVSRDLPGPQKIGQSLGDAVSENRLLVHAFNETEQPLFDRMGVAGRFAPDHDGDFFSLRTANNNPNKIDTYLQRAVDYDVTFNPETGETLATATITLTNRGPARGLPDYVIGNRQGAPLGSNTMYLSFYSPLGLDGATLNGFPVGISANTELGTKTYSTLVTVPAGETATLALRLSGELPDRREYQLHILNQPTVLDDEVTLSVHSASSSWHPDRGDDFKVDGGTATRRAPVAVESRWRVGFDHGG